MRSSLLLCALLGSASLLSGCPSGPATTQNNRPAVQTLFATLDQEVVVPTSVLRLTLLGTERTVASKVLVRLEGTAGGDFEYEYESNTSDLEDPTLVREGGDTGDLVALVPVDQGLWDRVGGQGSFQGKIALTVVNVFGDDLAEAEIEDVSLTFQGAPTPNIAPLEGGDVYVGERVEVVGTGFLRPEEGQTYATITSGTLTTSDNQTRELTNERVPLLWGGSRTRAFFVLDPKVFGVRTGSFQGTLAFSNELRSGQSYSGNAQDGLQLDLQQSFISTLSSERGSRGEKILVNGRGMIETTGTVGMTLRFEGVFTPERSSAPEIDFRGDGAQERSPDRFLSDQQVELSVWYEVFEDGGKPRLRGLGAEPGQFEGTITPVLFDGFGGEQVGLPWQGTFEVLPTTQVVYLKYLPRFSSGLDKYGLRNVETELRAKIREVAQAPYAGYNVEFRDTPPEDFVLFATVELSGPDPYGSGAFGYDNSFNGYAKDTDNLFLGDYIGGISVGSEREFDNPFGGIYIESFDYFSVKISSERNGGAPNEGASTDFDRILEPFMPALGGKAVAATEWPDGPRAAEIEEAIHMVGNVIGNTVAHEVGHSMGLAFYPSDRLRPGEVFHNKRPEDGALMDSGGDRPFDERANLNDVGAAEFNTRNKQYLGEILPGTDR